MLYTSLDLHQNSKVFLNEPFQLKNTNNLLHVKTSFLSLSGTYLAIPNNAFYNDYSIFNASLDF